MTAIGIIRLKSLFAAVMLAGIYSLLSAAILTSLDAVDVAFTEAAVGAGISTVLMLGTLSLTQRTEKTSTGSARHYVALAVVILTGAVLVHASFDMPAFGDPNAPIHTHPIIHEYLDESYDKFHIPNVVTSVLASYRGYDTFGETTVIFTAGVAVLLLLGGPAKSGRTTGTSKSDEGAAG